MKKISALVSAFICVSLILFLTACQTTTRPPLYPMISLVELLANPEKFVGKRVGVTGYYHQEFESSALFLTRDDERFEIIRNGIWIYPPEKDEDWIFLKSHSDSFVTVFGVVRCSAYGEGHLALFRAGIEHIDRVSLSPEK